VAGCVDGRNAAWLHMSGIPADYWIRQHGDGYAEGFEDAYDHYAFRDEVTAA